MSSIFERIAADHFDGADEKFAVKAAGGVKEYDPLRDGPLRYLGYANECGCVLCCTHTPVWVAGLQKRARPWITEQHGKHSTLHAMSWNERMNARMWCREAFAAWLPFWGVPFSYAVAVGYVLVDTADKGLKAYALAQQELDANASLHPEVDTPRRGPPASLVSGSAI